MRYKLAIVILTAVSMTACIKTPTPEQVERFRAEQKAQIFAEFAAKQRDKVEHAENAAIAACESGFLDKLERIGTRNIPAFGPHSAINRGGGIYDVKIQIGEVPFACSIATADGVTFWNAPKPHRTMR